MITVQYPPPVGLRAGAVWIVIGFVGAFLISFGLSVFAFLVFIP